MTTSITADHQVFEDDHPKYAYQQNITDAVSTESSIFSKLKNVTSVSEILRLFGACAVIASMSLFLLNGWAEGNDIQRYLKLLTQTGLLTLAGFAMSYALKENKGARLFFALALISVVANFTILGALTYSLFQLDGNLIDYPSMVTWTVVSASSFWPVFMGAVIALMVLARFSFSIFARNIATPLSMSFLAMNALLLIPVRSSLLISFIAIFGIWISALVVKKLAANDKVVFTKETKFALSLLFAPALLIIARAVSLYHVDDVLLVLLSGLSYVVLRFAMQKLSEVSLFGSLVKLAHVITAVVFSLSAVSLLPHVFDSLYSLVFSAIAMTLTLDQIKTTRNSTWKQSILNIMTMIIVAINVLSALEGNNFIVQLFSVLVCGALLYMSAQLATVKEQNRFSKLLAFIGLFISVGIVVIHFVELINVGNWMLIGLLGGSLIVMGSLYERFGLPLSSMFSTKS